MKFNKILASLFAITVVGASMLAVSVNFPKISITANAEETKSPLEYEVLDDGTIEITGCDETVTEVEIPVEIDGKKVTSIGNWAFERCSSLTLINIPNNVTSIGDLAFWGCSSLTEIIIPDSVTSIGYRAFEYCSGLTEITIPDSVTSIGYAAFQYCSELTSIAIPDGVTSIGEWTLYGCSKLKSIIIPDSITSIDDLAFSFCSSLTEITIPDSVTNIGDYAFQYCSELTSITILNPKCEIYNNSDTISNTATIYGYENSTAQAYAEKYDRKFESLGKAPDSKVTVGDANCDGTVSIADATAILQHLGNQDKYGLSAQGLKNADVDGNEGVSTNDALVIQMVDAKLLTAEQLPLKNK